MDLPMRNRPKLCLMAMALLTLVALARAQIVAETIGFTSRDRQMYGPAVRFLAFDSLSGTHAVWRDGYGSIRYNFRPRSGGWRWPGGMTANSEPRTLGSMDFNIIRGSAMISTDYLHRDTYVLTRLVDSGPGTGHFHEEQAASNCRYTLIGAANFGYYKFAAMSDDSLIYQALARALTLGHVGAFPAFNLTVSKQSGQYGFIWAETEGPDRGTLFLRETPNNGANWFAISRLSDSVPSPLSRSFLSGCGTYDSTRIHLLTDLYDGSDVLHSQIWHYTKYPEPIWRLVRDYSCPTGTEIGNDALAAGRSSIGMNRALGELYAVWEQFDPDNVDPVTGLCRADIWAARTGGAARNWSPAMRLTQPDSTSKRFPFLSEVVNDTLHIIYFADKVAGFSEQGQGPQTTNAVVCLRVPVDLLPSGIEENRLSPVCRLSLNAYPNPFRGTVTIHLSDSPLITHHSSLVVRVFDAAGRLVRSAPVGPGLPASFSFGDGMRPGIYFVTAGAGPDAPSCRIVKTP
jgi:hypothetical protein